MKKFLNDRIIKIVLVTFVLFLINTLTYFIWDSELTILIILSYIEALIILEK